MPSMQRCRNLLSNCILFILFLAFLYFPPPFLIPVAITQNLRRMHGSTPSFSASVRCWSIRDSNHWIKEGGRGRGYHLPQGNQGRLDQRSRGFRIPYTREIRSQRTKTHQCFGLGCSDPEFLRRLPYDKTRWDWKNNRLRNFFQFAHTTLWMKSCVRMLCNADEKKRTSPMALPFEIGYTPLSDSESSSVNKKCFDETNRVDLKTFLLKDTG